MHTITSILMRAGSSEEIAKRATKRSGKTVTSSAVRKWRVNGIPGWHIPLIAEMTGVAVAEILAANMALYLPRPTERGGNGNRNRRNDPRVSAA